MMKILRCEICKKPCTLNVLDDRPVTLCPVTGEKADWKLVNKRWGENAMTESEQTEEAVMARI